MFVYILNLWRSDLMVSGPGSSPRAGITVLRS